MFRKSLILFIILLTLSACTRSTRVYEPTLLPTLETTESSAEVVAEFPTPTALSTEAIDPTIPPTVQPTAKPTLPPYEPFTVTSAVDGLLLRSGPGTEFVASTMLFTGDEMTTNFMAEGSEWLNVTTANGDSGFVFVQLLTENALIATVPIKAPEFASVVKGTVRDANGTPIQGVVIAFTLGESQINVNTNENGEFYFYHHPDTTGEWTLSYAAISCVSNVWVGTDCAQMKPEYTGVIEPATLIINLPYTGEPIQFTWR